MINFDESIDDINTNAPSEDPSIETGSSHKKISVVWNDFEIVLVDGVYKAKYRKYAKLYNYFSFSKIGHLKRIQESHRLSNSHL